MALPRLIPLSERYYAYIFEKAGDELPLHDHTFTHDTVVAAGKIEWFTERRRECVEAWHVITFLAGVRHGIVALTDGASVVQCNQRTPHDSSSWVIKIRAHQPASNNTRHH